MGGEACCTTGAASRSPCRRHGWKLSGPAAFERVYRAAQRATGLQGTLDNRSLQRYLACFVAFSVVLAAWAWKWDERYRGPPAAQRPARGQRPMPSPSPPGLMLA